MFTLSFVLFMIFFFYLSGLWVFCSKRKHLLMILLMLEYMVLINFLFLVFWLGEIQFSLFFSMIYLVFVVCEGALGLGILVSMVRFYGNDFFQSLMILRC